MTYEEVKQIRNNPTAKDVDNKELSKMIDQAVEKQIPKKFEIWNGQDFCPTCNALFGSDETRKRLVKWEMAYYKYCGQALDWSDDECI